VCCDAAVCKAAANIVAGPPPQSKTKQYKYRPALSDGARPRRERVQLLPQDAARRPHASARVFAAGRADAAARSEHQGRGGARAQARPQRPAGARAARGFGGARRPAARGAARAGAFFLERVFAFAF
jgi:hypothetical protein